jgi:hypothetical protein
MTAEGQRMDLVVIRPTLSLLAGEGGTVTAEREARRPAESPSAGGVAESGECERNGMWPTAESPTWIFLRDLVAFLPGIPEGGATPPGCANERRRLWRARR